MNIHEFGKENKETLLLIHPSIVKWDYFDYVVPLLEKKYHLLIPVFSGIFFSIRRRIYNADLCPLFPRTCKTHLRSWHTDQISKSTDSNPLFQRQVNCLVNKTDRSYTYRTSRS